MQAVAGSESVTQSLPGTDPIKYPRFVDFENGRLILLDSMQEELDKQDGDPGDLLSEGKLGKAQLAALDELITQYRLQSPAKKLIVCLHHSPFHLRHDADVDANCPGALCQPDSNGGLDDAEAFLLKVSNISKVSSKGIDCLLFGHTSPPGTYQQGDETFRAQQGFYAIPLISCENLEHVDDTSPTCSYPVTVLDLGTYRRLVFYTDDPSQHHAFSWGGPPG